MADSETEQRDEGDDETVDVDVLQSGREEARVVLNHQLRLLAEMHTKAMRTVRLTVLVLGLVLSAMSLPGTGPFVNRFTLTGVGFLSASVLSGLVTYSASDPDFGTGPEYLRDARAENYSEAEWFGLLVRGYEDWIRGMEQLNDGNARMLTYTQASLGIGIVLLVVGAFVEAFV